MAALVTACTEPLFVDLGADGGLSDAGRPPASRCDAGRCEEPSAVPDSPIPDPAVVWPRGPNFSRISPDWAALLEGRYAVRIRLHGRVPAVGASESAPLRQKLDEIIGLAVIRRDPGPNYYMEMELWMCSRRGEIRSPDATAPERVSLFYPRAYPVRRYPLEFKNNGERAWETNLPPTPIGYQATVEGCMPGREMRRPEQAWFRDGVCVCPSNEALPTARNDCRLTDPDGDREPGILLEKSGPAGGVEYHSTVIRDFSQFVHGQVDARKFHVASFHVAEDWSMLACEGACDQPVTSCHAELNTVNFRPIPDGKSGGRAWECDDIILEIGAEDFFPKEEQAFPEGC